jgi:hypothetical protein
VCKETEWEDVDHILLSLDRDQGSCEHGDEPLNSIKRYEFLEYLRDC